MVGDTSGAASTNYDGIDGFHGLYAPTLIDSYDLSANRHAPHILTYPAPVVSCAPTHDAHRVWPTSYPLARPEKGSRLRRIPTYRGP